MHILRDLCDLIGLRLKDFHSTMGRRCGGLSGVVGVLLCLTAVSPADGRSSAPTALDAALHHYDTLSVDQISHHASSGQSARTISLMALDRQFHMVLVQDTAILAKDFAVYVVDGMGNRHRYDFDPRTILRGHLKGEEQSTLITAHVPNSGIMTAVIATPTDTYHIEPSHHYIREPHPFHMVAYAKSHVKNRLNSTRFDYSVPPQDKLDYLSKHQTFSDTVKPLPSRRLRRQTVGNIGGNTCNTILVADFSAFSMFGGVESASSQMVLLLSSIDKQIYRPTQWSVDVDDNTIDQLGHSAAMILVHNESSPDPMNYNRGDTTSRASEILGFMRFGPWSPFCLAHLFTNRNFPSGLLGLANIASPLPGQPGGICSTETQDFSFEPPRSVIYNTGISTYNNNGQQMILSEMVRVVGHELGHNWGSHHDPNVQQCDNFLMNEFAQDGSEESHMAFSICSRRSIGEVLINKASCFDAPASVCGDYQVSEMEQCDAGKNGDSCCTSQCMLRQGSNCSDVNSLCCEGCVPANTSTVCRIGPRLSANCLGNTTCNGVSITCPDTPEPVANGTRCRNGICLFGDVENSDQTVCVHLCLTLDRNYSSCTCASPNDCKVCCEGPSRTCGPVGENLADGSPCLIGVCKNGTCSRLTQDQVVRIWTIIVSLNGSALLQLINENIVGCMLIFTIPVWCLGSCLLYWCRDYPRKKKFEEAIDKAGINVFIRKDVKKPSASCYAQLKTCYRRKSMEEKALLDERATGEPEDDMPPPEYTVASP